MITQSNKLIILTLLWIVTLQSSGVMGLRLVSLEVPEKITSGKDVKIRCQYDLEHGERLYSVKWYKGQYEFYRYSPKDKPNSSIFGVAGISVDLDSSDDHVVTLKRVHSESSGVYRCEVSTEVPTFESKHAEKEMRVIAAGDLGLQLISLDFPEKIMSGKDVKMTCQYDLQGERLYSVKWYKDNSEFYRYLPKDKPNAQALSLAGISVDLDSSDDHVITLKSVDSKSSGVYRCEVSTEAPTFDSKHIEKEMIVITGTDQSSGSSKSLANSEELPGVLAYWLSGMVSFNFTGMMLIRSPNSKP